MGRRLKLQAELEELLGTRNVYFQPPETKKLVYPCIIYNRQSIDTTKADDSNYLLNDAYELTVIYKHPDDLLPYKILGAFKYIKHDRHFTSDNLNHDTFNLYY